MTNKLMLVVDLEDSNPADKKLVFDREMQTRNWQKVQGMHSAFVAEIEGNIPDDEVLVACELDLADAANIAEITRWDATCLIC